jgi:hypothetical protein
MYTVPAVRQTPLWLIFAGLFVLQLAPLPAVRATRSYTTARGCRVEILNVGVPSLYTRTTNSCRGQTVAWQGDGIGLALGLALTIASLVTNTVAERRRGASGRQAWLAALIVGLGVGGLGLVVTGLGASMTCRNAEGMCGLALLVPGTIGLTSALIGLGVALVARKRISRLTRAAGYGAIPAMVLVWLAAGIGEALLR